MCQKKSYTITVSGPREDLERLLGSLVVNSSNLTREFTYRVNSYVFFFRYRGDARIVLRKVSRQLHGKSLPVKDEVRLGEAVASISRVS